MGTSTGNKFGSCCHSQAIKFLYLPCANCLCKQNYFNDWINSVLFARARHAGCPARGPSPPVHCFILFHLVSFAAHLRPYFEFHLVSSCFILFHLVSFCFISFHLGPICARTLAFHLVSSRFILFHLFHLGGRRARQPCAKSRSEILNLRTELFRPLWTRQRSTGEMRPNLIAMEIKISNQARTDLARVLKLTSQ